MLYTNKFPSVERILTMTPTQELHAYVKDLVAENKVWDSQGYHLYLNDLDDDARGKLTALLLEADDRAVSHAYYKKHGDINDDITCSLLKLLVDNSPDNQEDFANLIRNNIINKCKKRLQDLLDEECNEWTRDEAAENGFSAHHHADNGEIFWAKGAGL